MTATTEAERSVIDAQIAKDRGLMETITLQCDECQRYGPANVGLWRRVNGVCYCEACANAENQ